MRNDEETLLIIDVTIVRKFQNLRTTSDYATDESFLNYLLEQEEIKRRTLEFDEKYYPEITINPQIKTELDDSEVQVANAEQPEDVPVKRGRPLKRKITNLDESIEFGLALTDDVHGSLKPRRRNRKSSKLTDDDVINQDDFDLDYQLKHKKERMTRSSAKQDCLTLAEKIKILNALDDSQSEQCVAADYQITRLQVQQISATKDELRLQWEAEKQNESQLNDNRVGDGLFLWYKKMESAGQVVRKTQLKDQCIVIAGDLGLNDFNPSDSWIARWKSSHDLPPAKPRLTVTAKRKSRERKVLIKNLMEIKNRVKEMNRDSESGPGTQNSDSEQIELDSETVLKIVRRKKLKRRRGGGNGHSSNRLMSNDGDEFGLSCYLGCDQEIRNKKELRSHFVLKHPDLKPYRCALCQKDFMTFDSISRHKITAHATETTPVKHRCEVCQKIFGSLTSKKNHMRIHTGDLLRCHICSKGFTSQMVLDQHQIVHTRERNFSCEVCGKKFINKFQLNHHNLRHTGQLVVCDLCGKGFESGSSLSRHMQTHSETRDHICQTCGKAFKSDADVKHHIKIHNPNRVKKWKCQLCDKSFYKNSQLIVHMRVHNNERPFGCETCGMGFFTKHMLARHEGIHTGERKYKCSYCPSDFIHSGALYNHMKMHDKTRSEKKMVQQQQLLNPQMNQAPPLPIPPPNQSAVNQSQQSFNGFLNAFLVQERKVV